MASDSFIPGKLLAYSKEWMHRTGAAKHKDKHGLALNCFVSSMLIFMCYLSINIKLIHEFICATRMQEPEETEGHWNLCELPDVGAENPKLGHLQEQ